MEKGGMEMKWNDRYEGKCFSVLGDSISTLGGYTEPSDAAFYDGMMKFKADVFLPEDTWWGQVIERLGGFILVNNSYSGSMVHKAARCEIESYGCSDERTASLARDGAQPDVVMVFMGINDWGCATPLMPNSPEGEEDISFFSVAYRTMLQKLKKYYPMAEIWCLTLPESVCRKDPSFVFPCRICGKHIEEYSEVIRACAEREGCRVIGLDRAKPHDTIDGFHPNAQGMKQIADHVIEKLSEGDVCK